MVTIVSEWWLRLLLGLIGSGLISYAAYRKRSLSRSGMWSAVVMGTGFVVFGEPIWFTLLMTFFVSSTLWSKWKSHTRQKKTAEENYEKSGRRDAGQVWANGGLGLVLCVGAAILPHQAWLYAYIGVMATVTADTWATEIGSLSKGRPISIVTWKAVPTGTSGGISLLGTMASFSGAACIGLVSSLLLGLDIRLILFAALAGFIGAMADSYLGAKWQVMYACPSCGIVTERTEHCNGKTHQIRGLAWCNNDAVNMLSSIIGGCFAIALLFSL